MTTQNQNNNGVKALAQAVGADIKDLNSRVTTLEGNQTANDAKTKAEEAATTASQAKQKAETVEQTVTALQGEVQIAKQEAETAKQNVETAKTELTQAIATAKQEVKDEILGGAADTVDTLKEIADLVTQNNGNLDQTFLQKVTEQNGRIDAVEAVLNTDLVTVYNTAKQ